MSKGKDKPIAEGKGKRSSDYGAFKSAQKIAGTSLYVFFLKSANVTKVNPQGLRRYTAFILDSTDDTGTIKKFTQFQALDNVTKCFDLIELLSSKEVTMNKNGTVPKALLNIVGKSSMMSEFLDE
jgi:hypothetical protein|tara:strand:- start:108 stop:482 length:375 start_codon:yes stop_codon:yes gene_type:complete